MSIPSSAPVVQRDHLWHPFSVMPAAARNEVVVERGEGVRVWDREGHRYLDGSAALWYCNVGHGRTELADVARDQMTRLAGYQTFDVFANEPALALAERLTSIAPTGEGSAAFLTSGGSDSVDTAGKVARRYWQVQGRPDKTVIVARGGAYHGMHAYGTSLAGIEGNASGWGTLVGDVAHVPPHDVAALSELLERDGHRIAAFIGEPVIGAGGVHPPVEGYWSAVQDLCRHHDVLLVVDEVVTGFGRLGTWFASERFGITPDLVTGAKGVSSGYLPLGLVLAGPRVLDVLWGDDAPAFRHGYTYSGHPAACAVGLANLDIIEREGLCAHVRDLEPVLASAVGALADHELVGEVRAIGLLAGVELDERVLAATPGAVDRVVVAARERGLLVRGLIGRAIQISPPLIITADEIAELATVLRAALDAVAAELRA